MAGEEGVSAALWQGRRRRRRKGGSDGFSAPDGIQDRSAALSPTLGTPHHQTPNQIKLASTA